MTAESSSFHNFILAQLKCAGVHSRLITAEIDGAVASLAGGFIDTAAAIGWLDEIMPGFLVVPSSIIASTTT